MVTKLTLVIVALLATLGITPRAQAATHRYLVIGASVTRLAGDDLRGYFGDTMQLEAVDGRSFVFPDNKGGPSIWGVFMADYQSLRAGDWLVLELAHGGVEVDVNRRYLQAVVARLDDSVCLAVVAPHTYYGDLNSVAPGPGWSMQQWNAEMRVMEVQVTAAQPCRRIVEWDRVVNIVDTEQPAMDWQTKALGAPVLYDGRHPTDFGGHLYALAMYRATHP